MKIKKANKEKTVIPANIFDVTIPYTNKVNIDKNIITVSVALIQFTLSPLVMSLICSG